MIVVVAFTISIIGTSTLNSLACYDENHKDFFIWGILFLTYECHVSCLVGPRSPSHTLACSIQGSQTSSSLVTSSSHHACGWICIEIGYFQEIWLYCALYLSVWLIKVWYTWVNCYCPTVLVLGGIFFLGLKHSCRCCLFSESSELGSPKTCGPGRLLAWE